MAKPRIFISSTFYDLRQVRSDLDQFIESLGYEPIRNEEGDIPYGKEEELEVYCYKEIKMCDILVCIIGNKYGSESKSEHYSITQKELKTAIEEKKQVYIFIDKSVLLEYEIYILNKNVSGMSYKYVDNPKIYTFIEEIKKLRINNNIKSFETTQEITTYLREQLAGLFKRFLDDQNKVREINAINQLEKTSQTLNQLVALLAEKNESQSERLNEILMINNPLVSLIQEKLNIPYNFYIYGLKDLKGLLKARSFSLDTNQSFEGFYFWSKNLKNEDKKCCLKISKTLFDENEHLQYINKNDWKEEYFEYYEEDIPVFNNDDLPF